MSPSRSSESQYDRDIEYPIVFGRLSRLVDDFALCRRAAAAGQACAIRPNADVPEHEVGFGDWLSEPRTLRGRATEDNLSLRGGLGEA